MSKKDGSNRRARYTVEFKLEAVRLVKAGKEASLTARVLGVPKQTLSNWVRLADKGALQGAGERRVSAEPSRPSTTRASLSAFATPQSGSCFALPALVILWLRP